MVTACHRPEWFHGSDDQADAAAVAQIGTVIATISDRRQNATVRAMYAERRIWRAGGGHWRCSIALPISRICAAGGGLQQEGWSRGKVRNLAAVPQVTDIGPDQPKIV